VGRYLAPAGLDVMAAVSATLPVKPPLGEPGLLTVTTKVPFVAVSAAGTDACSLLD